jgi:Family of unknown function (DUF6288)
MNRETKMNRVQQHLVWVLAVSFLVSVAFAEGPETFQLGPTGLIGSLSKNTAKVTKVEKGSPADGKIKVGDEIIGAGEKNFKSDVRQELAAVIDKAETEQGGGKLTLNLKGNKKVDLQLAVLGSYSATAPYDCPKSQAIITRAAEAILKAGKIDAGATHTALLGLMATGEQKYMDAAAKAILAADWAKPDAEKIESLLKGDLDMGYVGWYWGYNLITLSEYYLLTKDASVLPAIKTYALGLARGQDAGGLYGHRMATPKRNGRLPGYAQMNQPSLSNLMGMLLAQKCGIDDPRFTKGLETTYAYYASYVGKGGFPYGVHGPNSGTYNNNGTSGSAALCMAFKGNTAGAKFFSQLAATSYDGLEKGHASTFFNPLWTPLGSNLSGPEVTQKFFKKALWYQTMYRSWNGGFSRFGGNSKEGDQAGVALLAYCLPRRILYITGKQADESIWVKGMEATEVVERSKTDYKSKSVDELLALMGHPLPQVTRAAVWTLREKEGDFIPKLTQMLKEGTKIQKESAIEYFGWKCPTNQALAQMELLGSILRNKAEDPEVRAAAAGSLACLGEAAYPYYNDMLALIVEDEPGDTFRDVDQSVGKSLNALCENPYKAGLVTNKDLFYKAALKLADHKRQHARADGLRMLEGIPLEDFKIVADKVMHVVENNDPTYHSYHSPGGSIGSGVAILANLNIREGMQYALDVLDDESGKGSFKLRMVMDALAKYGPSAKPMLEKVKADPRFKGVDKNPKLSKQWNNMVNAIEGKQPTATLISLEEAKKAGGGK